MSEPKSKKRKLDPKQTNLLSFFERKSDSRECDSRSEKHKVKINVAIVKPLAERTESHVPEYSDRAACATSIASLNLPATSSSTSATANTSSVSVALTASTKMSTTSNAIDGAQSGSNDISVDVNTEADRECIGIFKRIKNICLNYN